jgi:hypothetical protein
MKTMLIRSALATILLAPALAVAACQGVTDGSLETYRGDINGKYRIQMTLAWKGDAVEGAYFYFSQLKDIGLRGGMGERDSIALEEHDAAGKVVATFAGTLGDNCGVIKGSWQKAGSADKLPFSLRLSASHSGRLNHQYGHAGAAGKEIAHANAHTFWAGVKNGDKQAVASVIDYPLRAQIKGKQTQLRNAKEFIANYDAIFTPAFRLAVVESEPDAMSSSWRGIMLGERGEVWLDVDGKIKALNN